MSLQEPEVQPDPFAAERSLADVRTAGAKAVDVNGHPVCAACQKNYKRRKGGMMGLCDTCNMYNANRLASAVHSLIYRLEHLERITQAPAVERIYEIGKRYIAIVPVTEGAAEVIGWKIAETKSADVSHRSLQPALFSEYRDARGAADAIAKARNNPALAGRIYEIPIGDLADADWTEPELYQHVERMWLHFAAEEMRLRPVASGVGAAGKIDDDVMTIASMAVAGPEQIKASSATSKIRCRRCREIFEMPAVTWVGGDPVAAASRAPGTAQASRVPVPAATFCVMCTPIVMSMLAQIVLKVDRVMRTITDQPAGPPVTPATEAT